MINYITNLSNSYYDGIRFIHHIVYKALNLPFEALWIHSRKDEFRIPRQCVMALCAENLKGIRTLSAIGYYCGGYNHATITHARDKAIPAYMVSKNHIGHSYIIKSLEAIEQESEKLDMIRNSEINFQIPDYTMLVPSLINSLKDYMTNDIYKNADTRNSIISSWKEKFNML